MTRKRAAAVAALLLLLAGESGTSSSGAGTDAALRELTAGARESHRGNEGDYFWALNGFSLMDRAKK